jgi:hypothetical protein
MLWKNASLLALASGLLVQSARLWLRRSQTHSAQPRRAELARAVQRWEDEGGSPADTAAAPPKRRARKPAATQASRAPH